MNNFWTKVAIAIVAIVVVVVVVNYFKGPKAQPKQEKTVGDTWREDDKRLRAEPNVTPTGGAGQVEAKQAVTEQPKQIQFKELTEEERAGAEQLFEMAITSRKMARLPGMSYGQMVNYCRDIIQKYPGSEFDYKARRMLGEVPQREWDRYKITQEEIRQ
ncbi:MAG: hypothetical protein MUO27_03115 [Sedimentisphaerales bacterium]|nr:hypothetical protein [Sedimentisphaerales bacterium]